MARGQEPLLRRPSSENSNDREVAEEDALLTGQKHPEQKRTFNPLIIGALAWASIATIAVIILAIVYQQSKQDVEHTQGSSWPTGKRNLIFMVSDGMGPTSMSMTRSFKQFRDGTPFSETLTLDKYVIGQSRTRSTNSLVTDSAAGATAFSCGIKSYNGAISVLDDGSPCGSVMEAAKLAGYKTGLVVTTRITDATPAVFAAHVNRRSEEDRIAEQMIGDHPLGRIVDIMLGGGRCHFLPSSEAGSCRSDDKDIIDRATANGFEYISSREEFDGLEDGNAVNLPLLGLFAPTDIPYELDRRYQDDIYPSLKEMAVTALNALKEGTRDSSSGFFIMIEGSRIDHAGHGNDPAAQVHEVLAYDETVKAVLEWIEKEETPTIMVSTSDHETGGLATARQLHPFQYPSYLWYPDALANASHSASWLTHTFHEYLSGSHKNTAEVVEYLAAAIPKHLGIYDATEAELESLLEKPQYAAYFFADMISRRAQIGWSTHGHSAADVNIYASDPKQAKQLIGSHENTEVGKFLSAYLDVDVDEITEKLKQSGIKLDEEMGGSWMGQKPVSGERLDGQDHMDHYHGDVGTRYRRGCDLCSL